MHLQQFQSYEWTREDLATIYDYIVRKGAIFYRLMKWGLQNKLDLNQNPILDIVFILSSLCLEFEELSEESDEEIEGV